MKIVLRTGWKKSGRYRVRSLVKEDTASQVRRNWFRRIVISSRGEDDPESPPTDG